MIMAHLMSAASRGKKDHDIPNLKDDPHGFKPPCEHGHEWKGVPQPQVLRIYMLTMVMKHLQVMGWSSKNVTFPTGKPALSKGWFTHHCPKT